ncbi:MAG: hypothetical protein ABS882_10480 [Lysinibacillus sp.]
MKIGQNNTEAVMPKQAPKTTEEVLKSSRAFLQKNQQGAGQKAYDVKVETPSSKATRTIQEKTTAVNALQTADSGMKATEDILKKMHSIAEQATKSTLTTKDREKLQKEYDSLSEEITKIGESTNFNGHKLLDGKFELETEMNINKNKNRSISIGDMRSDALGISKVSLASPEAAEEAAKNLQKATETVSEQRKAIHDENSALEKEITSLTKKTNKNLSPKNVDTNTEARELLDMLKGDIMKQAKEMRNNLHAFNTSRILNLLD